MHICVLCFRQHGHDKQADKRTSGQRYMQTKGEPANDSTKCSNAQLSYYYSFFSVLPLSFTFFMDTLQVFSYNYSAIVLKAQSYATMRQLRLFLDSSLFCPSGDTMLII